jgi:hypothetical protein
VIITHPRDAGLESNIETRRRLDSLPASLRPYIVFSMRKSMYGFPALSCFKNDSGRRERRDTTCGMREDVSINFNKLGGGERGL